MAGWRKALLSSTYYRTLISDGLSHNDFWRDFGDYDALSALSGYPGDVASRLCACIRPDSTVLDIGAGTGAFALPLADRGHSVIALDPSSYHLGILRMKAASAGCAPIRYIEDVWGTAAAATVGQVDYAIAAYSMIDPDLRGFIAAMLDCARRGILLVYRAGEPDSLDLYTRGDCPRVDYRYLTGMLDLMGCEYQVEFFDRAFCLPFGRVLEKYRDTARSPEEILKFLEDRGRVLRAEGRYLVQCAVTDALIIVPSGSTPVA